MLLDSSSIISIKYDESDDEVSDSHLDGAIAKKRWHYYYLYALNNAISKLL